MKPVPANRYVLFCAIVCAGIALDLWSKSLVFGDLGYPGGGIPYKAGEHQVFAHPDLQEGQSRAYLDGWVKFRLFTSFNRGALWGIGQGWTAVFAVASVAAIAAIVIWLFLFAAARSRWLTVALSLIFAGTIGNLWDRLALHGCTDMNGDTVYAVRDFLLFTFGSYHYPIFNFADSFLVTGAIMLVLQSLMPSERKESGDNPPSESSTSTQDGRSREAEKTTSAV
jgi:signal peptidase II